ncbi:MAG: IclR family transcriptional regulator [Actinomycetota bacterium]
MIRSVIRAGQILKELASGSPRLGVTELSERLGLAKATVYGLLRALEDEGLAERDPETGKYRLGATVLQLGNAYLDGNELRARSLLWADSLAERAMEAVRVGVVVGADVVIVHHVFRPDDSVQMLEVGAAIPWHASALGKAIVAHLDGAHRDTFLHHELPMLTGRTVTEPDRVLAALDEVRRRGVAIEDQEAVVGEAEIAAPVFGREGPVGAIGVAGPAERLVPDGPIPETVAAVREVARRLSKDMGGRAIAARSRRRAPVAVPAQR